MKRQFLLPGLILPLFLAPLVAWGPGASRQAAVPAVPAVPADGDKAPQRAADQAPADPQADADDASTDSDQPARSKTGVRPTSMAIIPVPDGVKTLTIHFRWSLYPHSSIEVRLVPETDMKAGAAVTPIYFAEHLKGKVREALYACLDHPGDAGRTHTFTEDKTVYKMIGRRNSLGNQGVHVQVHREESKSPNENPAAAYLQLDTWAVDKEMLSLDLARDEFAKPGKLFVWFFRGERVVWDEQIRWPGYGSK